MRKREREKGGGGGGGGGAKRNRFDAGVEGATSRRSPGLAVSNVIRVSAEFSAVLHDCP